jgi:hypothetical protein
MVVLLTLLTLTTLTACGKDKYADARDILAEHADVMEAYITGLENATNPADCAAAINAYTDGMEKLIPRLKTFQETYPDLAREGSQDETPPEIAKEAKRLEALGGRMPAATMNMMKYMTDPQVQAAMERMTQTMQKMGG